MAFYKIDVGPYLWGQSFTQQYLLLCHALSQTIGKHYGTDDTDPALMEFTFQLQRQNKKGH